MVDLFVDREYFIDRIWFYYDASLHSGNGFMTWNPDRGFHVAARVTRSKPYPKQRYIGAISFDNGPALRMKLENGLRAFAPRVQIDDLALAFGGHLSLDLHRLIFIQAPGDETNRTFWLGSAMIETKTNLALPDIVQSETKIGAWEPSHSFSRSGLHYEDNSGQKIIGQLKDKTHLYLDWRLPKSNWTKGDSWKFADGLQHALSMVAGEVTQLRYHEARRGRRIYTEMRARYKASSLGILLRIFDQDILDKNLIVRIANFLARSSKGSDICRKIFRQVVDASHQNTRQGCELLISTILEAALRSLYNYPFDPTKNKRTDAFSLEGSLKTFRENDLSNDVKTERKWRKVATKVIEAQRRLRDRNAHPDWLSTPGGAYSPTELRQSTNDLILLSRFYGYMILALAGFKELQPKFPASVDSWSPLVTVTYDGTQSEE